ncbi:kinesin-like protein KIN-UB isoform X3 [Daucus carota subsp. sativus]|uniref:kinesin-like protein KIN-UB isoform X3 n=1 Tax=Daucus carota subsp. sativus TaxID=79200 RepID=UPI0007EF501A|nr:PREDICTED: armadillo repeat-containing kinesin-like protein 2 isoform X3 [Daucus carota subsp. sativus]
MAAMRSSSHTKQSLPPPPPPPSSSSGSRSGGNSNHNSNGNGSASNSTRSKLPQSSRRSVTPSSRSRSPSLNDPENGRVRVAVRLRPRTAEDLVSDADFSDCVEIQPELKKLKLRKNNWSSEAYRFDEVFSGGASQRRIYEVVAKPVVESVLDGYNGTIMAYGQTGTGKTYTLGRLGEDDASERGIMVRALEDMIANTSAASDNLEISYLQLYMESVQDLLAPEKINIPIAEDPKTGEVSAPGASVVGIQNLDQFLQVLKVGESNRHAANTKMNTESSRSHAILMINVRRSVQGNEENDTSTIRKDGRNDLSNSHAIPTVRRSKLLIVDLAGSERLDKSGSEGHTAEETKFINLSLSSLGKCINALAENSPHIPTRDSKLTRLLRDSFGGSARTSLIITIGPSSRHHAETTSTIMFGQRAMKVVNTVKLKEEFDYEILCRKLEKEVDHLTAEMDRQLKIRDNDIIKLERKLEECRSSFAETESSFVARSKIVEEENSRLQAEMKDILTELSLQKEHNILMQDDIARLKTSLNHNSKHQLEDSMNRKVLAETTQIYEKKIADLTKQLEDEHASSRRFKEQSYMMEKKIAELMMQVEDKCMQSESAEKKLVVMRMKISDLMTRMDDERCRSESAKEQIIILQKLLSDNQTSTKQIEHDTVQKALAESTQRYEKKIANLFQQVNDEKARSVAAEEQLVASRKLLGDDQTIIQISEKKEIGDLRRRIQEVSQLHDVTLDELQSLKSDYKDLLSDKIKEKDDIDSLKRKLQEMSQLHEVTVNELQSLKSEHKILLSEKDKVNDELCVTKQALAAEERRRKTVEHELDVLKKVVPESEDEYEDKRSYMKENIAKGSSALQKSNNVSRDIFSGQRTTIAKICEEVGLQKILALLTSSDIDVQIHAVKVIANLAAEDVNQEKIVEEGGLDALLMLLRSSHNTTILRVASGAVANLAMNEKNQSLITSKGGARLLANTASRTDDPQTLRMVAGAIANLCGNEKLHVLLREEGGIKALLGMVRSGNSDVIAQVARGIANFAKCESRGINQGLRKGRSLLIEDAVLEWLISNSNIASTSTRRHIELALCHLAQNVDNAKDLISSGGLKELVRISTESSREDIRNLATKTLRYNIMFQAHT